MDNIIGLFFDYVYPLTPALHRPSFMADLAARRDKTDPVFLALALVVLASTLVQVPRVLISLDKDEVEQLARRCVRVARAKMGFIWDDSVPMRAEFGMFSAARASSLTKQLLSFICTLVVSACELTSARESFIFCSATTQRMSSQRRRPTSALWRCG